MNWQNRHLSDISDIYRAYNGHNLMFTWRLFGECTVLQRGAKEVKSRKKKRSKGTKQEK